MNRKVYFLMLLLYSATALPAANIIWVDEGAADGFTGWQELLEGAGHTVTRMSDMRVLDSTKIEAMNNSDLVIMSRDTNSGDYANDAAEIAQWNGLAVPLMQTSSYLIRNNRWLWVNDAGVPALGAADNLLIVEDHPVFRGVGTAGDEIPMITGTVNITGGSDGGNGQVLGTHTDGRLWIVYWEAGTEFYSGSGQTPATACMWFGAGEGVDGATKGALDLTDEGQAIFLNAVRFLTGGLDPEVTSNPVPASGSTDVAPDTVLTWDAGELAAEHDVYLATSLEDVNNATTGDPAYMGRQAETSYEPAALDLGVTYFWRVDEVNSPPDSSIFKGAVWNFAVEPVSLAIPIGAVTATASSNTEGQPADNSVNGSGLNENDEHSNVQEDMWLAGETDLTPTIQFEFAQIEKLDKVHVWNHNTQTESILGFGIKEALVEYSIDGENWVEFGTVTLPQATASSNYAGEELALDGIVAKVVRITGLSNFSILGLPQKGLSEVRFYALPMRARLEVPASGSADLDPTVELSWRAGRDVAQHEVLIGTDPDNLELIATVDEPSYTAVVDLDSMIYWQVNEINNAMDPAAWEGDLWSLDTAEYVTVDDMESYKSKEGFYVWETWVDGFGDDNNGALLGHGGDDMETGLVFDGDQSLPYYYGQGGAASSEAFRDIERDWGQHGIVSLSLMFQGNPSNTPGQLYIKVNDEEIATYPTASDLTIAQWQAWTIDLPASALGNVKSLAIGVKGGTGLVLIDAIRLYAKASETVTPEAPSDAELLAYYNFEGNYDDASGNGLDGAPVDNPSLMNDPDRGQVLTLDGVNACVDLGASDAFNPAGSFSLAVWANITDFSSTWGHVMIGKRGEGGLGWQLRRESDSRNLCFTVRGTETGDDDPKGTVDMSSFFGEWIQVTAAYDSAAGLRTTYINGLVDVSIATTGVVAPTDHNTYIGARANAANDAAEGFFGGMLDEVRIYNRALSQSEALGLAGRTEPIFKAF